MTNALPAWVHSRTMAACVILSFALVWRMSTFGNPTLHVDEEFYFLVGQRMHEGLLPYVDIWDRKPFGLFVIYYAIAAISFEPAAYQIAASVCAAATGFVIYLTARIWTRALGAMFAALVYIAVINVTGGNGGQAPVFHNLPVAMSALLLLTWYRDGSDRPDGRVWGAMLALGIALTIKQTVVFEAAFMGLFVLWALRARGASMRLLGLTAVRAMAIGALPTLCCLGWFAFQGQLDVYWQATVSSNANKSYPGPLIMAGRALVQILPIMPVLALAALSFIRSSPGFRDCRPFLNGWLVAAALSVVIVPNFYYHYLLPLWVPAAVIASEFLGRRIVGPLSGMACIAYTAFYANPFAFEWTRISRADMRAATDLIEEMDEGDSLLVFEGPTALYSQTGRKLFAPLVFPTHLNLASERDVSTVQTMTAVEAALAQWPDVIVMTEKPRSNPANLETWDAVRAHADKNCAVRRDVIIGEIYRRWQFAIYARCSLASEDR